MNSFAACANMLLSLSSPSPVLPLAQILTACLPSPPFHSQKIRYAAPVLIVNNDNNNEQRVDRECGPEKKKVEKD